VEAPPEVVFDVIADPSRAAEWQSLLAEMASISGRPGGVGSSYVAFYRVAGRRLEARFVVTAAERPLLHQASGTTRGGWARWTTLIDPVEAGSDVRVDLEYELPGELLGGLFGVVAGHRLDREFRRTYAGLKAVAEADAAHLVGSLAPSIGRLRDATGTDAAATTD
jgi:hypothetical protein